MANAFLTLDGVSYVLPDGRTLFSSLNESFDLRRTGLVGRNGVGKSVLARILAGQLQPSSGRCLRSGRVHYLAQQAGPRPGATVAALAGVQPTIEALARIEGGSAAVADFEAVGERWDIRQRLEHALQDQGLAHLAPDTPAQRLSGGEAMRVALVGALLSEAGFLILDEPSNHLDRPGRRALVDLLRAWPRGLLVVSHDRDLLQGLERIVELSPQGLRSYGGNYSFYAHSKAQAQQSAQAQLQQCKLERRQHEDALREQRERQARRQARGDRQGKQANQAKILLGRQKERSEASAGRLRLVQAQLQQQHAQRVRDAAQQVEDAMPIVLHALPPPAAMPHRCVELDAVALPWVAAPTRHISLSLGGAQRVGVLGPNGCGKSTLLQLLAGRMAPLAGTCRITPARVYLDQQLTQLSATSSAFEQLRAVHRTASDGELRMRLAQLGLDARKAMVPAGALSGGERLKAALACVLYAQVPPQLLLLDEPSNHLDLPSLEALETLLCHYRGTLVVVSHDESFLHRLALTDALVASEQGWALQAWHSR